MLRCSCGHCSDELLQDAREYRCFKEILECTGKFTFEGKNAECITQHWNYAIVTHRTVLETAGLFFLISLGRNINQQAKPTMGKMSISQPINVIPSEYHISCMYCIVYICILNDIFNSLLYRMSVYVFICKYLWY